MRRDKLLFLALFLSTIPLLGDPGKFPSPIPQTDPWIPNFTDPAFARPTLRRTIANGNWFDQNIWSPVGVPGAGDDVIIDKQVTVVNGQAHTIGIYPGGLLRFATNQDTSLLVTTLQVHEGGTLEIGTESDKIPSQFTARLTFRDEPFDTTRDPGMYGHGLIAFGTVHMHGAVKTPYVRVSQEPLRSGTQFQFASSVSGWNDKDELIIPDTRLEEEPAPVQVERVTANGGGSQSISFSPGLTYDHKGWHETNEPVEARFLPHVANMSRNIIISSERAGGVRGHTMFVGRADVDIRYALFKDLGRTTLVPYNNTHFNPDGTGANIGTNQMGRYSLHMHHHFGPDQQHSPANNYQFTLIGNVVDLGPADHDFRWGIVIHDAHYGLVQGNVIYHAGGSCIQTESGSESFNVIAENMMIQSFGRNSRGDDRRNLHQIPGFDVDEFGFEGCAYWGQGPNNYVRDNIAASCANYSYFYYGFGGKAPAFRGANQLEPGQGVEIGTVPLLEFARNEAYSSGKMEIWELGANITGTLPIATSIISEFKTWNCIVGFFAYPVRNIIFDKYVGRSGICDYGTGGLTFGDYLSRDIVIRNADIRGAGTGISIPVKVGDTRDSGDTKIPFIIENSFLRCYLNVLVSPQMGVTGGGGALTPRQVFVRNVKFEHPTPYPEIGRSNIILVYNQSSLTNGNLTVLDQTFVYKYNGDPNLNFQVFYKEQAPTFALAPSGSQDGNNGIGVGCPAPTGADVNDRTKWLTNQQCWDQFGKAFAGEIASSMDDTTYPEIHGFVKPIAASNGNNQAPIVNAGPDQSIGIDSGGTLHGVASDDGIPNPLTYSWTKVSGPGTVTFGTPNAVQTAVTFSALGSHTLRLTATDGAIPTSDDVVITVIPGKTNGGGGKNPDPKEPDDPGNPSQTTPVGIDSPVAKAGHPAVFWYNVPANDTHVKITGFNISGRAIKTLLDESMSAGIFSVLCSAEDFGSSGLHFVEIKVGNTKPLRKKFVVVR